MKLKRIFTNIKHIIKWIPVLWTDKDWDSWYIYTILEFKLKNTASHLRDHNLYVGVERDCERIETCVRLIEKLKEEEYMTEWVDMSNPLFEETNCGLKEIDELERNLMKECEDRHFKARRILFDLLERNIEKWWD